MKYTHLIIEILCRFCQEVFTDLFVSRGIGSRWCKYIAVQYLNILRFPGNPVFRSFVVLLFLFLPLFLFLFLPLLLFLFLPLFLFLFLSLLFLFLPLFLFLFLSL